MTTQEKVAEIICENCCKSSCVEHYGYPCSYKNKLAKKIVSLFPDPVMMEEIKDYDCGLINDYGGGNVEWWQDYIRAEINRANDYWREQIA